MYYKNSFPDSNENKLRLGKAETKKNFVLQSWIGQFMASKAQPVELELRNTDFKYIYGHVGPIAVWG